MYKYLVTPQGEEIPLVNPPSNFHELISVNESVIDKNVTEEQFNLDVKNHSNIYRVRHARGIELIGLFIEENTRIQAPFDITLMLQLESKLLDIEKFLNRGDIKFALDYLKNVRDTSDYIDIYLDEIRVAKWITILEEDSITYY